MQERFEIINRRGQRIVGVVDHVENAKGVVVVMHGLGGYKEQPHLEAVTRLYQQYGYIAVRPDATHALGESDGSTMGYRATTHVHDLEDVLTWVRKQVWCVGKVHLAGHSMGGFSVNLYAQNFSEHIGSVASLSSTLSGEVFRNQYQGNFDEWQQNGFYVRPSRTRPGAVKKISWEFVEDLDKYDVLVGAQKMTMPVLVLVGDEDHGVSPLDQKRFSELIAGPSVFHLLDATDHNYKNEGSLNALLVVLEEWIKNCL
jgi:dienelactone hydrolase